MAESAFRVAERGLSRHVLRLRPAGFAAAGAAFGPGLPAQPCRVAEAGARAALWLGPDEFLLLAPEAEAAAVFSAIGAALAGQAHALVEVSHRQSSVTVTGAKAGARLSTECPLDLHASAFPVGMCTRTVFGKAEIVLWRRGEAHFHVETARSFVPYVQALLAEAAHEKDL